MVSKRKSILLFCMVCLTFIIYQLKMFMQLSGFVPQSEKESSNILGTHEFQNSFYKANEFGKFVCIVSLEHIDFDRVNDDYCDCLDGSDEPGTNACANGHFFCSSQVNYREYSRLVPSSRVNDGICDCCDGSDEWKHRNVSLKVDRK